MTYDRRVHEQSARERASTAEEHLWRVALAIGPDSPGTGMWETADGTLVDVARHVTALAEELRRLRGAGEQ